MSLDQTDNNNASQPEYQHRQYPGMRRSRAQLLSEIRNLSDDDYVSASHAAAVLGTSAEQLSNWRSQKRGPTFVRGKARFIRYKISDLKAFMADRVKATDP
jgi:hypothetical protein